MKIIKTALVPALAILVSTLAARPAAAQG